MSAYYIATTVNGREYVVLANREVVAGPFASVAVAAAARHKLAKSRARKAARCA